MENKKIKRIVVKVGTSSLAYENGKLNLRLISKLVSVLSDLMNSEIEVALVTSGAIGVGFGRIGIQDFPKDISSRQAAATIGQGKLMMVYDKFFAEYGYSIGQLLITKEDIEDLNRRKNLINTFNKLFEYEAIPIINENDAVAIDEIVYGDNDTLSAVVAGLLNADMLILMTDADGLYNKDPHKFTDAKLIKFVSEINDEIKDSAANTSSKLGRGGMATKVNAAEIAKQKGIVTVIMNAKKPTKLYKLIDGESIGTKFLV